MPWNKKIPKGSVELKSPQWVFQTWAYYLGSIHKWLLKIRSKLKIFEILIKLEDYSSFSQNWRYLRIWSKLKIFQILVKIEDFWKLNKIFQILAKNDEFHIKKLKDVSMLGFEHPSHMVTHPSTNEAQCCLSLEFQKMTWEE